VESPQGAQAEVAKAAGLAHIATPDEIKDHGWACPRGRVIVVFDGRHPRCRFRAYRSLGEGIRHWVALHRRLARKTPGYLAALNRSDTEAVAHTLAEARYFTASASDYARRMAAMKVGIDGTLGRGR
jgi:hypothetical protein